MVIRFDTMKTVQATAVLLKEEGGRMTRLRLLKLLYISDRESIAETLRPITGDDVVAMDHGPVLSETYRLIRGEAAESNSIWDRFIARKGPRDHVLVGDPGNEQLSQYEMTKLRAVSAMHRGMTDYQIADETHKFPEWIKNQPAEGGREKIPLHDLLEALGMKEYEKRLAEEEESERAFDAALASAW